MTLHGKGLFCLFFFFMPKANFAKARFMVTWCPFVQLLRGAIPLPVIPVVQKQAAIQPAGLTK